MMLEEGIVGDELCRAFATKLAKAMLNLSSSHVYFIVQQAYGANTDWGEVAELLRRIIDTPPEVRDDKAGV